VAAAIVQLSDFGGAAARLLNVCSYPSQEPNSAPSECVITPNNGFLTIVKSVTPSDGTNFVFNLGAGQKSQSGQSQWTIAGAGQVQFISFPAGTSYDLSEAVPQGWMLSSASCALQTNPATGTGSFSSPTVSDFTIQSGLETICTFTNAQVPGTLIVEKVVINDSGGTGVATDFSFQVDAGPITDFLQDGADPLKGKNTLSVQPGTYTVTEGAAAGYTTTPSNCSNIMIAAGQTKTCTITNDDQPGTLIVTKVVVNSFGGTKVASNFSFQVNGGTATAFEADGSNSLTVNAGTYTITEPAVDGYTAQYNNCENVVVTNGGTTTCTITNRDTKAAPALATVQRAILHDRLNVTGITAGAANAATATATFVLYSDAACTTSVGQEVVTLSYGAGGTTASASTATGVLVTATGVYRWRVTYSGDAFNQGDTTACGSEVTNITITN
jgi:hypothetical protein